MNTNNKVISTYQNELKPGPARKSSDSKPAVQESKSVVQGIYERVFSKSQEDNDVGTRLLNESDKSTWKKYGSC